MADGFKFNVEVGAWLPKLIQALSDPLGDPAVQQAINKRVMPLVRRRFAAVTDTLRPYPPRRYWKRGDWSNDPVKDAAGRRGFFARYPNGYTRTGALGRAWNSSAVYEPPANIVATIENPNVGASYVYGSEPFGYRQSPGHVRTGFQNFGTSFEPAVEAALGRIGDALNQSVADSILK